MKNIRSAAADRRFGVVLIIISAASFGVMPIFARLAYNAGAEPITVLFLRFTIAAVVMNLIMVLRRTAYPRGLVLLELILLGAIAYVGESLAYFLALEMASAGLVALLLYIYPALVTVLSAIFLKEHLTRMKIVALFLALSGTALTLRISGGGSLMGIYVGHCSSSGLRYLYHIRKSHSTTFKSNGLNDSHYYIDSRSICWYSRYTWRYLSHDPNWLDCNHRDCAYLNSTRFCHFLCWPQENWSNQRFDALNL